MIPIPLEFVPTTKQHLSTWFASDDYRKWREETSTVLIGSEVEVRQLTQLFGKTDIGPSLHVFSGCEPAARFTELLRHSVVIFWHYVVNYTLRRGATVQIKHSNIQS
jgi:hypothetical protein